MYYLGHLLGRWILGFDFISHVQTNVLIQVQLVKWTQQKYDFVPGVVDKIKRIHTWISFRDMECVVFIYSHVQEPAAAAEDQAAAQSNTLYMACFVCNVNLW